MRTCFLSRTGCLIPFAFLRPVFGNQAPCPVCTRMPLSESIKGPQRHPLRIWSNWTTLPPVPALLVGAEIKIGLENQQGLLKLSRDTCQGPRSALSFVSCTHIHILPRRHMLDHGSRFCKSPKEETTHVPISSRKDALIAVHSHNGTP